MSLYSKLASLPLAVDGYELAPLDLEVTRGWTRRTTTVRLTGAGQAGEGEDVSYDGAAQLELRRGGAGLALAGEFTLDSFGRRLDDVEPFRDSLDEGAERLYRRWAFESAALDLALRQAGRSLGEALGIEPRPVRYVCSMGLGDSPSMVPLRRRLALYPGLRFKLDPDPGWSAGLIEELSAADVVETLDLKGQYSGSYEGTRPDPALYRRLAEAFPRAWLEDPRLTAETSAALAGHEARFSWDAPIHALADLLELRWPPGAVNIKPSRFGFLSELLRTYEYCAARGWPMYGGGQFELGVGRRQIQCLASLFHADAGNDVAPSGFNARELAAGLPASPLPPATHVGF